FAQPGTHTYMTIHKPWKSDAVALSKFYERVMLILKEHSSHVAPFINPSNSEEVTFMATAASQKPLCPVCHQADQVKTTQAAYDSGVAKCAPPDMPTRRVSMLRYIAISAVLVGVCIFLIIVLVGSESLGADRLPAGYTFDIATIFSP